MRQSLDDTVLTEGNNELNIQMVAVRPLIPPTPPAERTSGQHAWYYHMCRALEAYAAEDLPKLITIIIISPGAWPGYWKEGIDLPPSYPRAATITTWEKFEAAIRMGGPGANQTLDNLNVLGRDIQDYVKMHINGGLQFPMGERLMGKAEVRQLFNYYGIEIDEVILSGDISAQLQVVKWLMHTRLVITQVEAQLEAAYQQGTHYPGRPHLTIAVLEAQLRELREREAKEEAQLEAILRGEPKSNWW